MQADCFTQSLQGSLFKRLHKLNMNLQPQYDPFKPVTNAQITNDPNMTSAVSMDHKSVLDSNLPADDAHVGDAQVCTGTMHVPTVGRQQLVKKLDIC